MKVTIDARAAGPRAAGIGAYAREMVRATGRRGGDNSYLYLTDPYAPGLGLEERADRRELCVEASGDASRISNMQQEIINQQVTAGRLDHSFISAWCICCVRSRFPWTLEIPCWALDIEIW
jgi:hypothetical protein